VRIARLGSMAPSRNRNVQVDSTDVSTADVSVNEDTEMTDSHGPSNGASKFGVSAPWWTAARAADRAPSLPRCYATCWLHHLNHHTDYYSLQYYQDTPDYTVRVFTRSSQL
jgi:hypothetical protein